MRTDSSRRVSSLGDMRNHGSATVCIPAHNEVGTIGDVVSMVRRRLLATGEIQEIVVVDDRSTDGTGEVARRAGARVIETEMWCSVNGGSVGKGDAIWASIAACRTELIGWLDGDVSSFDVGHLAAMFRTLRGDVAVQLVKGAFDRRDNAGRSVEGRLTALTARPLLSLFYPEIADLREPLGGIFAMHTDVAEELSLDPDYGVDIGIVIDVVEMFGRDALIELPMGSLEHRSRPLAELKESAFMVSRAIVSRALVAPPHETNELALQQLDCRRFPVSWYRRTELARVS